MCLSYKIEVKVQHFCYDNRTMHYIVFTDGSSLGNPGPGGWGAVVVRQNDKPSKGSKDLSSFHENEVVELGAGLKSTTNNRMELTAAVKALLEIPSGSSVTVYTDSSYLINGITKWIAGWKRNGWQTKTRQDVLNKDIWQELERATQDKTIVWKYVGGHIGVAGNERCDEIATSFAASASDRTNLNLYKGSLKQYSVKNILDISHDVEKLVSKSVASSRSSAKAYSYISSINGDVKIHKTWAECELRVKGVRGARYKKALNPEEQEKIIQEFRSI